MRRKRDLSMGVAAILAAPLLLGSVLVFTSIAGYRAQIILSDSMRPTFSAGSLVIIRTLSAWQYRKGDVVSFIPPIRNGGNVTHRIVRLYESGGVPVMQTKGDGNIVADQWITGVGAVTGREVFVVPFLGYAVQLLKTPVGFLVTVTLSFLIFVLKEIQTLVTVIRNLSITNRHETSA